MKNKALALLIVFTALAIGFSGCNMNRNPAPKPAPGNMRPSTPAPNRIQDNQNNLNTRDMTPDVTPPAQKPGKPANTAAKKLADAAKRVEGVEEATVVISGARVFAGIEIDEDVEENKTEELKTQVVKEIKKADTRVETVHVTADPNIVTRIEKVAKGIEQGRPVSEFASELEEIARLITPSRGNNS